MTTEETATPVALPQENAHLSSPPSGSQDKLAGAGQTTVTPTSSDHGDAFEKETATPPAQEDAVVYVEGYKLAIVIASVCLSCFLMLLDTMIISTAIPRITDEFNSLSDVGWYASAYQFGSAAPQPLTGRIYQRFSTKWVFLCFFAVFEVGSVICGAATSSDMLIVGRAVAGMGAAGIIIGAITIVSSCVPLEKRPGMLGITMGFNQLGLLAGPVIGGAFTSYSTWRWCFYVNLPAGAIAVVAISLLRIPEQTKKPPAFSVLSKLHKYLDLVGFVLFAGGVLQFLLALQYGGNKYPWGSSRVIGLFCGAAATGIVWFFWNKHKGEDGLLPYSMISRTAVWSSGLYQACLMCAVYGAIYFLPIYFQSIHNASPIMSGVYLLPLILPQLLMAASSGAIITKIGYVIPLALFSTLLLSTASGLYSILRPDSPKGEWIGFMIIGAIGTGAGLQVAIIAIQAVVSGAELSSGMAWMVFAQSLAPAIELSIANVIFSTNLKSQLAHHAPNANATDIIHAGATGFRAIVNKADLPGVLVAYSNSINRVFYLIASIAALCGVFVWGMGWNDIRKKDAGDDANKAEKAAN